MTTMASSKVPKVGRLFPKEIDLTYSKYIGDLVK